MTYARARKDFEDLEEIRDLDDQVELDSRREELMQNPTKAMAMDMYQSAIQLWMWQNRDLRGSPEVEEIASRHNL
jgi:hypothetical protein